MIAIQHRLIDSFDQLAKYNPHNSDFHGASAFSQAD
jgi:hypothetical protein